MGGAPLVGGHERVSSSADPFENTWEFACRAGESHQPVDSRKAPFEASLRSMDPDAV